MICSVTSSAPFGSTWMRTSAAGSEYDLASAAGATASAQSRAAAATTARRQNLTCGASRAGSSISKKSFGANPKVPATRFVGTVWVALL